MCVKPEKRTQNAFKSKIAENISNNRFQWFFMHTFNGNVQCLTYSTFALPFSLSLALSRSDSVYALHYTGLEQCRVHYAANFDQQFTPSPFSSRIWFNFASPYNYLYYFCFFGHFTLEFSLNFKLPVVEWFKHSASAPFPLTDLPSTMQLYCAKHFILLLLLYSILLWYFVLLLFFSFCEKCSTNSHLWLKLNWWSLVLCWNWWLSFNRSYFFSTFV